MTDSERVELLKQALRDIAIVADSAKHYVILRMANTALKATNSETVNLT